MFFENVMPGALLHHSTVEDNQFIDKEYLAILDGLKTQDRNKYNIYRLGLWGRKEEIIYTAKRISPIKKIENPIMPVSARSSKKSLCANV